MVARGEYKIWYHHRVSFPTGEYTRPCVLAWQASWLLISTYNIIQPTFESEILWDILIAPFFPTPGG